MHTNRTPYHSKYSLRRALRLLVPAAVAASLVAGCDAIGLPGDLFMSPTGGGGGGATYFGGYFLADSTAGPLTIFIPTSPVVGYLSGRGPRRAGARILDARGKIAALGDSSVSLSGTYSQERDSLYLEGGGYTLIGLYEDAALRVVQGTVLFPGGQSGTFRCLEGALEAQCGPYASESGPATGSMIVSTDHISLIGLAVPTGASTEGAIEFEGVESYTNIGALTGNVIKFAGGSPGVLDFTGVGTHADTTDAMAGHWVLDDAANLKDDAGTWSTAACLQ